VSNLVALMPATMLAALSDRTQLPPFNHAFIGLIFASVVGAGVGILILGVFSIATGGDYRSANVAKNLVSSLNGLVASLVFIAQGAVVWPQTLALMAGTIGGGLLGAHIARVIPRQVVRVLIVLVGAALTAAFAGRYWFN
jgi:hypothetical protein